MPWRWRWVVSTMLVSGILVLLVFSQVTTSSDTAAAFAEWEDGEELAAVDRSAQNLAFRRFLSGSSSSSSSSSSQSSSASHGSASASGCAHQHAEDGSLSSTLAFLFLCFLLCTLVDHANMYVPIAWRFPISVILFIWGVAMGLFFLHVTKGDDHMGNGFDNLIIGVRGAAFFDPHALLYIVLPPLLYESASAMHWHVLKKVLPSALLLAIPGVVLNTLLTGCFVKLVVDVGGESPSWEAAMLLAAILSATDPVAVVAALAALGAPKKLSSLVEGESLLNDGSAVVAAYVFRDWVMGADAPATEKYCEGSPPSVACIIVYFLRMALGGSAIGAGAGYILYVWIKLARARSLVLIEMAIVLTFVYGTFYIAEAVQTSGVLAVVALGFLMSSGLASRLSHDARHNHHVIFSQIAYSCNQVAFLTAGIVSSRFLYSDDSGCDHTVTSGRAWGELIGLYFMIHVTRAGVVAAFWPFLRRLGYGITWKEALILIYGGLRGAVGLMVGLIVEHSEYIAPDVSQMIAFHTSGIVLLTLFINGSTIDGFYKRLRLYPTSHFRMTHIRKVLSTLETKCQKAGIKQLSNDWFFKDCQFSKILRCVPHFDHIAFDPAGLPVPDNIDSVHDTLESLEEDALAFLQRSWNMGMKSFDFTFKDRWRVRKLETEGHFLTLLQDTAEMKDVKDTIQNILNTGNRNFEYAPSDKDNRAGYYVSSRTLASLGEDNSFKVKIAKLERVDVIVGLVTDPDDIKCLRPIYGSQALGVVAENSVGLNCATGVVHFNGPAGAGDAKGDRIEIGAGCLINVQAFRPANSEWEVEFRVFKGHEERLRLHCSFGPFTPTELYPAIEFRTSSVSRMFNPNYSTNTATSLSTSLPLVAGATSAAANAAAKGINDVVTGAGATVKQVMGAATQVSTQVANTATDAVGLVGDAVGKVAAIGARIVGGGESPAQQQSQPESLGESGMTCKVSDVKEGVKLTIDFEPQLATDAESINEFFHRFFNTVLHVYKDMHEHGILGNLALSWVTEAVGVAMDSANSEVNSLSAMDFKKKHMGGVADESFPCEDFSHSPPTHNFLGNVKTPLSSGQIRRLSSAFNQLKATSNTKARIVGLFEPLFIEYLCLESMTSGVAVWDRCPGTWPGVRCLGYALARARVESLWAFVGAHEKVAKESPALERFPMLVQCINHVVEEARNDLGILADLSPLRFYYSKHLLALRVMMQSRRQKLVHLIDDGWIAAGDGDALMEEFDKRIVQVNQFYPPMAGSCCLFRRRRRTSFVVFPLGDGANENAWDDYTLPSVTREFTTTVSRTPTGKLQGGDGAVGSRAASAPPAPVAVAADGQQMVSAASEPRALARASPAGGQQATPKTRPNEQPAPDAKSAEAPSEAAAAQEAAAPSAEQAPPEAAPAAKQEEAKPEATPVSKQEPEAAPPPKQEEATPEVAPAAEQQGQPASEAVPPAKPEEGAADEAEPAVREREQGGVAGGINVPQDLPGEYD